MTTQRRFILPGVPWKGIERLSSISLNFISVYLLVAIGMFTSLVEEEETYDHAKSCVVRWVNTLRSRMIIWIALGVPRLLERLRRVFMITIVLDLLYILWIELWLIRKRCWKIIIDNGMIRKLLILRIGTMK